LGWSMSESEKTTVITGAGGLLGRCLTAKLTGSGWRVLALTHSELDITDENHVCTVIRDAKPEVIINCAATADVDRCEREPDWAFSINERGPQLLAVAGREVDAQLVHISTDYVFDGSKEGFYTQTDDPNPISIYGKSKLAGELAVGIELNRSYVIRSSWIFGAGGKNFGSRVVEYARRGGPLKGVIDQTSIPTYAPDLAARIEDIIGLGRFGLYHVTSSGPTTWFEFARRALDLAGLRDVQIEPITRAQLNQPAPRPHNSAMRCLLSPSLGLEPLRHWSDALEDFAREFLPRQNPLHN
jgi:dTDP-4-dehydrorhamnose reductase